jgi:hypothetical protein
VQLAKSTHNAKKILKTIDQFRVWRIVEVMAYDSRKDTLKSALSTKGQRVSVRALKTPLQVLVSSGRYCLHGNWNAAATSFRTAMNMIWTLIVHPITGANRKP